MKKILVVIPTYNAENHVTKCLTSIREASQAACNTDYVTDVVVVDDRSPDNTVKALKDYGFHNILSGTGDLWWSGSVNKGIGQALEQNFDYIMLLNSDNTLSVSFFANLYAHLKKDNERIIGSVVYDLAGNPYFTGCNIDSMGQFRYIRDLNAPELPCSIFGGMGVLIPTGVFRKVGLFDEKNFPLYFGDTDFWLKCKRAGIPSVICNDMHVYADLKNTGIKRSHKGLMHTVKNMFNIRFHANIKTVSKFYFKNFSVLISPIAILLFYVRAFKSTK